MNSAEVETVVPPTSFDTHHDDVIHDAKVDFYGRRLATASSDRTIRIFQINESETETLLSILSGHEGPVWQVAWAHPKFGSILASCSYDGSVIIWQEDKQQKSSQNLMGTHSTWTKTKVHRVHESSVNSICFAPHSYGLHLACASSDGKVSIISQVGSEEWQTRTISAHSSGCNSVSWCPSTIPSSLLALDFNALDKAPVPLGPKMIATGGCDNTVKLWKAVIEAGEDGVVSENWELEVTLNDHTDWVRDVCWRPNMGQVGHILVSCSQDNTVLIWRFDKVDGKWKSRKLKSTSFPETLWRVSFSEYGHLLAVSCGDNTVTLWKESAEDGTWVLVGNVDETVTETVKIEEPLAVAPPPSAPIPQIDFRSSAPKIASDVGYMKPMSPMMLTPSIPQSLMSPGYNQIDQAYDDFQNAQVPTIPLAEQTIFQTNLLAEPVIPVYNQEQVDFNKDIGFINSNENQDLNQIVNVNESDHPSYNQFGTNEQYDQSAYPQYEQPTAYEQQTGYEQPIYEQEAVYEQQPTYEQKSEFEQSTYEQADYEQATFEQQTNYEQANYEQSAYEYDGYEQPTYEQQTLEQAYEQPTFEQPNYEQPSYEQTTFEHTYEQQDFEQPTYEQTYEQPTYETPSYEQPAYDQYSQEQSGYPYDFPTSDEQKEDVVDYTLQYEGYQSAPIANSDNDAVNF